MPAGKIKRRFIITRSFNPVVCNVIDWLNFYKIPFERINDYVKEFNKINYLIEAKENGTFETTDFYWIYKIKCATVGNEIIETQLVYEYQRGFFNSLKKCNVLGQQLKITDKSKFEILQMASEIGLKIPKTILTNNKTTLLRFLNAEGKIITKSCHDMFNLSLNGKLFRPYTKTINKSQCLVLPDKFGISLFQKYIPKLCDIKVFFLDGEFYGQAIFSQNDKRTQTDFRLYNSNKPTRRTPFKLDVKTEKHLYKLLTQLEIKIATIDFILDSNNDLYFLEINPDGIFEDISTTCNYNIEKLIAEYIKNHE